MANFFKAASKSKPTSQQITVTIDKLDMNGVGIAFSNKKPIFIAGALPKEVVTVKTLEEKSKYARAKLISIEKQSDKRIQAQCQHFGVCGGCDLQMLSPEEQLHFKQQKVMELFSRSYSAYGITEKITTTILPWHAAIKSQPWHYRRKARLGVQFNKKHQATVGFRQKSTNQLASIKACPVLVESLSHFFPLIKEQLAKLTIKSAIGHIEVIEAEVAKNAEQSEKKVVLVVRQLKPMNGTDINLWQQFSIENDCNVLIDNGDKKQSVADVKTNEGVQLLYKLTDSSQITFSSNDFIQINHQVNLEMIDQALAWLDISSTDIVLDLFCGLGNFSLPLAKQAERVVGVEGVQFMVDKASYNAKLNGIANCQFYQADLNSDWLSNTWAKEHKFNKVLLDPARAGAEQAVEQLVKLEIPDILYVSCDPATLARDSAILVSHGYKIEKIALMDMFCQTKHVETMVLFRK